MHRIKETDISKTNANMLHSMGKYIEKCIHRKQMCKKVIRRFWAAKPIRYAKISMHGFLCIDLKYFLSHVSS